MVEWPPPAESGDDLQPLRRDLPVHLCGKLTQSVSLAGCARLLCQQISDSRQEILRRQRACIREADDLEFGSPR